MIKSQRIIKLGGHGLVFSLYYTVILVLYIT